MDDIVRKAYHVFWLVFAVALVLMFFFLDLSVVERDMKQGCEVLTEYTTSVHGDVTAPLQTRTAYTFVLDGIEGTYCHLIAYTEHQEIRVFLEDTCIYRVKAEDNDMFGKSPGNVWMNVPFAEEDNGKTVTVELSPVYKSAANDKAPIFYLGAEADIMHSVLLRGLPNFVLSLFTVAIGIVFLIFIRCNYKESEVEKNLWMVGYFVIHGGLLHLVDSELIPLLFPNTPAISSAFPVVLMFVWMPIVLVFKNLYSTREHPIWYLPCGIGFFNMGVTFLLQYMDIADMYQMLPLIRFNIAVTLVLIVVMTVYEVKTQGWNKLLIQGLCVLGICFVGEITEIVLNYVAGERVVSGLSIFCIILYAGFVGFKILGEVKDYMEVGIKAKRYENMAFHDQLTGLFNRTAFAEHTGSLEFIAEKCIIVVMDLNNLKSCNDKLGHAKGDIYIKESARMIQECFGDIGKCYRMGGDEFYVLIENGNPGLCRQRLRDLKERVAKCDKVGEGFRMGIACGFKMYDGHMDYDIHETARRADKVMYQEKFAMKEL